MDSSILVQDTARADVLSVQAHKVAPDTAQQQETFGDVLGNQYQNEDSPVTDGTSGVGSEESVSAEVASNEVQGEQIEENGIAIEVIAEPLTDFTPPIQVGNINSGLTGANALQPLSGAAQSAVSATSEVQTIRAATQANTQTADSSTPKTKVPTIGTPVVTATQGTADLQADHVGINPQALPKAIPSAITNTQTSGSSTNNLTAISAVSSQVASDAGQTSQATMQAVATGLEQFTVENMSRSGPVVTPANHITAPGLTQTTPLNALTQPLTSITSVVPQTLPALAQPIADSQWNSAFSQRITWAVGQGIQAASLAIHPEELGPITIQIAVQDDVAKLQFTAMNGLTRDAIESALPRLRESLQENGIAMGQVNVSGDPSAQSGQQNSEQGNTSESNPNSEDEFASMSSVSQYASRGLVDTFV